MNKKKKESIDDDIPTKLQSGDHVLKNKTLEKLGLTKEQGKIAIEGLKKEHLLPPDAHNDIYSNGDLYNKHTGEFIDNLYSYLP